MVSLLVVGDSAVSAAVAGLLTAAGAAAGAAAAAAPAPAAAAATSAAPLATRVAQPHRTGCWHNTELTFTSIVRIKNQKKQKSQGKTFSLFPKNTGKYTKECESWRN